MTTSVVGACVWGLVSYVLKLGHHDQQLNAVRGDTFCILYSMHTLKFV